MLVDVGDWGSGASRLPCSRGGMSAMGMTDPEAG